MTRQAWIEPQEPICYVAQTAVTASGITAMWDAATYSAFPANSLRVGQLWRLTACGVQTISGTPTPTATAFFGTTTGGTSLGAGTPQSLLQAGGPFQWWLEALFRVNTIGSSGTVALQGVFTSKTTSSTPFVVPFGGTTNALVTVDTTAAAGLCMGWTWGAASSSLQTLAVVLEALN